MSTTEFFHDDKGAEIDMTDSGVCVRCGHCGSVAIFDNSAAEYQAIVMCCSCLVDLIGKLEP